MPARDSPVTQWALIQGSWSIALNSSEPNYMQPFGGTMVGRWRNSALWTSIQRVQGGVDCSQSGSQFRHGSELPVARLSASPKRGWWVQKRRAISERGEKKIERSEWGTWAIAFILEKNRLFHLGFRVLGMWAKRDLFPCSGVRHFTFLKHSPAIQL